MSKSIADMQSTHTKMSHQLNIIAITISTQKTLLQETIDDLLTKTELAVTLKARHAELSHQHEITQARLQLDELNTSLNTLQNNIDSQTSLLANMDNDSLEKHNEKAILNKLNRQRSRLKKNITKCQTTIDELPQRLLTQTTEVMTQLHQTDSEITLLQQNKELISTQLDTHNADHKTLCDKLLALQKKIDEATKFDIESAHKASIDAYHRRCYDVVFDHCLLDDCFPSYLLQKPNFDFETPYDDDSDDDSDDSSANYADVLTDPSNDDSDGESFDDVTFADGEDYLSGPRDQAILKAELENWTMPQLVTVAHQIHFSELWLNLKNLPIEIQTELNAVDTSDLFSRQKWTDLYKQWSIACHSFQHSNICHCDKMQCDDDVVYLVSDVYDYNGNYEDDAEFGCDCNRGHRRHYDVVPVNFLEIVNKMPVDPLNPKSDEFHLDVTSLQYCGLVRQIDTSDGYTYAR